MRVFYGCYMFISCLYKYLGIFPLWNIIKIFININYFYISAVWIHNLVIKISYQYMLRFMLK